MENFILLKEEQPGAKEIEFEDYLKEFELD